MGVLEILLPPACAGCGRFGHVVCQGCVAAFRVAAAPADRFAAADPGTIVGDALELAIAAFAHKGAMRRALQRLKYGGSGRVAVPLARAAAPALEALVQVSGSLPLVPVPVHAARLRQRGYNQALELIRAARTFWDERATGGGVRLVVDVLRRIRDTPALGREPLPRRQAGLRGAFVVSRPVRVTGRRILIVDDVMTTGATFSACAAVLLGAGAISGHAVALARAQ